ncbi:MAG: hypothetical protein IJR13_07510 [Bacteroidales bacterium]|nr:hypothetical protein [Bacteroidales bacterium]
MKRTLLSLIMLIPLSLMGQGRPAWLDQTTRNTQYPAQTYYTGIAYGSTSDGTDAIKRTMDNARADVLSTILTNMEHTAQSTAISHEFSTATGIDEEYTSTFSQQTRIEAVFKDVPDLRCEHYVDGSIITAFAYVRKNDLSNYYNKQIPALLTQIETILDNSELMVAQGQKIRAREMAKTAVEKMAALENAMRVMLAVDKNSTISTDKAMQLSKRLVRTLTMLKNGTSIYVACYNNIEGGHYPALCDNVKGRLSKLGINFVDFPTNADWTITIDTYLARKNEANDGNSFAWIDGKLTVTNSTGQTVYSEALSGMSTQYQNGIKGVHTHGLNEAIREAYKKTATIVSDKIIEIIQ